MAAPCDPSDGGGPGVASCFGYDPGQDKSPGQDKTPGASLEWCVSMGPGGPAGRSAALPARRLQPGLRVRGDGVAQELGQARVRRV
jgi:hypothetical protein